MSRIVLSQVCKRFGEQVVVDRFDMEMADGEFVVLVGPSGCGKSTTLRMVAGLEETSSGSIHIGDRDVTLLQPRERNVAMVFQNYALYPHKTVYENLAFGLRMRKVPAAEIDSKVRWAAGMLNIDTLLDRKPRQLSGGQMQRVSLGRALVRSPDVFLLDEPLSNLDAKLRVRMREEIGQLHQRVQTNMIYVTHDQVEAMTLGDRIVIMNQGRVQQIGRPLQVYDSPANLFVAGFIGAPEMNQLPGELGQAAGRPAFISEGLIVPLPDNLHLGSPGQKVVLGIRPEHARLAPAGSAGLAGRVAMVEQLGPQTMALVELAPPGGSGGDSGKPATVRVLSGRRDELQVGLPCIVQLDSSRLHLFDAGSGVNLALSERISIAA